MWTRVGEVCPIFGHHSGCRYQAQVSRFLTVYSLSLSLSAAEAAGLQDSVSFGRHLGRRIIHLAHSAMPSQQYCICTSENANTNCPLPRLVWCIVCADRQRHLLLIRRITAALQNAVALRRELCARGGHSNASSVWFRIIGEARRVWQWCCKSFCTPAFAVIELS